MLTNKNYIAIADWMLEYKLNVRELLIFSIIYSIRYISTLSTSSMLYLLIIGLALIIYATGDRESVNKLKEKFKEEFGPTEEIEVEIDSSTFEEVEKEPAAKKTRKRKKAEIDKEEEIVSKTLAERVQNMGATYCINCGNILAGSDKFCPNCGTKK